MLDTCTITRPVSPGVWDETAGKTVWLSAESLYTGRCRAQVSNRLANARTVGDAQLTQGRYMVCVPVDGPSGPLQVNDQVTLTVCANDPDLVGQPLRIIDVLDGTLLWQRDLICEHVTPATR